MSKPPVARLRRDLGRALRAGHPWVFADAISAPAGLPVGSVLDLHDQQGRWLGRGLYDPEHPIALRLWSRKPEERIDDQAIRRRLRAALALRRAVVDQTDTDAYRLVHGEADFLPGLICDRYADVAVLQIDSPALEPWLDAAARALVELLPELRQVAVRDRRRRSEDGVSGDGDTDDRRDREAPVASLDESGASSEASGSDETGSLRWRIGGPPATAVTVREHGMVMEVDLARGHKTGLYLDQRENRQRVRQLAAGRRVLNAFAYTGGFSLAAALGGAAAVTTIDRAEPAIDAARRNFEHNGIPPEAGAYRFISGDAFEFLAESQERFDLVIVDPPSMAPSRASRDRALGAYRRLQRDAVARTAAGGLILTASCSSHVGRADLSGLLADAARAAGRDLRILEQRGAGADHPTLPAWPEGDYLHAILAWVD